MGFERRLRPRRASETPSVSSVQILYLNGDRKSEIVTTQIEIGFPRSPTLDVGDIDIMTGNFAANRAVSSWIYVWSNLRKLGSSRS
jgi:hypothetical protein